MRHSGLYPLCGRGDINLYAGFAERMLNFLNLSGRVGCVLPTGIATDDSNKTFIQHLVSTKSVCSFFDFTNRGYLFPGTESTFSFCLFTFSASAQSAFRVAAQLWQVEDLGKEGHAYTLTQDDILRINPNTANLPIFHSAKDAALNKVIYEHVPILFNEAASSLNAWAISFLRMFDMTNDADYFRTKRQLIEEGCVANGSGFRAADDSYLPLYEAKLATAFNHRAATFEGLPEREIYGTRAATVKPTESQLANPAWAAVPRYWISKHELASRTPDAWRFSWFIGFRNAISAVADARTVTFTIFPRWGAGNSIPVLLPLTTAVSACLLVANFNAFVLDYAAKQKASGGNLNFYIVKQLPLLPPSSYLTSTPWVDGTQTLMDWLLPRVLELTFTAWDLEPFAMDCGWSGTPFRWDEERRFLLRCELDAAFFHLYLGSDSEWRKQPESLTKSLPTPRDTVSYIMDTFPIVKRKDEAKHNGDYRTKRVILEIYDAMTQAIVTGKPYQTRLDPPPADSRAAHESDRPMEPRAVAASSQTSRIIAFDELRVLRSVNPRQNERYTNCVPRLDLKVAAGGFSDDQLPEFEEWVEINSSRTLRKGMFVAQVVGHSMEPLIPDGSYCLFQFKAPQVSNATVGLFQLHNVEDPELGGHFTVKRLKVSNLFDPVEDAVRRVAALVPDNPEFEPITVESDDMKFVAQFLEVLQPLLGNAAEE